jgi:hypothetical protein
MVDRSMDMLKAITIGKSLKQKKKPTITLLE